MELIDTTLKSVFSNKYGSSIITLFLVMYGGLAAPTLPQFMVKLFENPVYVKWFVYKKESNIYEKRKNLIYGKCVKSTNYFHFQNQEYKYNC